jgi:outer membrane receptor for ferrienterochelin and colicins
MGVYDGIENYIFTLGLEGAYNTMDKYNLRNDGETFAAVDKEAVFFQAERFAEDVYSVMAGLRLERNSQFGDLVAAPKVSAMYHLSEEFRVLGGAGVGYRAPEFNEMYIEKDTPGHPYLKGNEDLKPEYSLGFNLGLEYAQPGRSAQVNFYYTELKDEIEYNDTGLPGSNGLNIYRPENIYRSMRWGADSEAKISVFEYGFFSAGYSYIFGWDREEKQKLHEQPAHTIKAKCGADYEGAGIYTYFQGRYFSPLYPEDPDYEARFVLDFYFSAGIGEHIKLRFSIDNLTGEIDKSLGPATAQTFSLGIQYSL